MDEDSSLDIWRTDEELRVVRERCFQRSEKEKPQRLAEKEKARKELAEKRRKEEEEKEEQERNRQGAAEEREKTQKQIRADREECANFGAAAPSGESSGAQRRQQPTQYAATDFRCRDGGVEKWVSRANAPTVKELRSKEEQEEDKRKKEWDEEFLRSEAELSRTAKNPRALKTFNDYAKGRRARFMAEKEAEFELERKRKEEQEGNFVLTAPKKTSSERSRREERSSERSGREEQEVILDETIGRKDFERLSLTTTEREERSDERSRRKEQEATTSGRGQYQSMTVIAKEVEVTTSEEEDEEEEEEEEEEVEEMQVDLDEEEEDSEDDDKPPRRRRVVDERKKDKKREEEKDKERRKDKGKGGKGGKAKSRK